MTYHVILRATVSVAGLLIIGCLGNEKMPTTSSVLLMIHRPAAVRT